jgi:hypothetical protein
VKNLIELAAWAGVALVLAAGAINNWPEPIAGVSIIGCVAATLRVADHWDKSW